jgi:hypothetical protein
MAALFPKIKKSILIIIFVTYDKSSGIADFYPARDFLHRGQDLYHVSVLIRLLHSEEG